MKRVFPVLLAVLLLAACSKETPPETTVTMYTTVETTTEDPRAGLPDGVARMPGHPAVARTDGAVTVYDLSVWGVGSFTQVYPNDTGVSLLEASGVLWTMDPATGLAMECYPDVYEVLSSGGLGFACSESDTMVTTYTYGVEQGVSWKLPENIHGQPVVDIPGGQIYYCTPTEIFAVDTATGLTRKIREHFYEDLRPIRAEGNLLFLETGEDRLVISTEDGRMIYDDQQLRVVAACDNRFLVKGEKEGVEVSALIENGELLWELNEDPAQAMIMPGMTGLLYWQENTLCHYSLVDGSLGAQLHLSFQNPQIAVEANRVWILDENILYCWDLTIPTQLTAKNSIRTEHYTEKNPDTQGLTQCKQRADAMGQQYGLAVHVWDAICAETPVSVEQEYRVDVVNGMLDQLEQVLQQFPEGFIGDTVLNGTVCVELVKRIERDRPFVQFWQDGDCHVIIAMNADVREAFITGLGWAVDTHILGNSRDLEYWNDENPIGFTYDFDYDVTSLRDDTTYLEGEERYFTDKRAMAFPTEDRARVFYYGMTQGNEEVFANPVLQKKLTLVCEGIRESYGLKEHPEVLPWEQYLEESLAYED